MNNEAKTNYAIPAAIIISGALIATALFFSLKGGTSSAPSAKAPERAAPSAKEIKIVPVNEKDHIRGNPKAPVKVVEFSDTECPFCKRFHPTMKKLMESELGRSGKVAWVYRHFPLDSLHQKARKEAEATECAAKLGGNKAFWAYLDRIFEITPANDGLDLALLPEIAEYVGLDRDAFNACLESGEFANKVEADLQDAIASGGLGTPYSVVISPSGKKFVINGAQAYETVLETVKRALEN